MLPVAEGFDVQLPQIKEAISVKELGITHGSAIVPFAVRGNRVILITCNLRDSLDAYMHYKVSITR